MADRHDIIDLFAGIAGVSAGFELSGRFRPALFVDIDESAKEAFAFNRPRLKRRFLCKDIAKVTAKDVIRQAGGTPKGIVAMRNGCSESWTACSPSRRSGQQISSVTVSFC